MEELLFYLILIILVAGYVFDRILDALNLRHWSPDLPEEVKDIYDEENYRRSQEYYRANHRFAWITSSFDLLVFLAMLIFGGFAAIDQWVHQLSSHPVVMSLLFFGILLAGFQLIHIPFMIYDTFVIEERFGFNKTTPRVFVTDLFKSWFLGALIGGGILSLVVWFWMLTGPAFWLWAWIMVTAFSLFMSMFYSNLIVPLFNRQNPLESGALRDSIEQYSQQEGFRLNNIFVIDSSRRSTKSNAYFTGMGRKKRVVLFDTLLNDLENQEIVAVLAHEIGHYKKKHVWWGLVTGSLQTGLTLFILSLLINQPALAGALGAAQPSFHMGLLVFGILYSPISTLLGLFMNIQSRKHEFQADSFARDTYNGDALVRALKKLSVKNLSNLRPHPLYVFVHYSHPPLLERIKRLKP